MAISDRSYYSLFGDRPDDLNFHLRAILELLEDMGDIEISPLCDKSGKVSPLLGPLMKALQDRDLGIEIMQSADQQHNPNAVLRVWAQECELA